MHVDGSNESEKGKDLVAFTPTACYLLRNVKIGPWHRSLAHWQSIRITMVNAASFEHYHKVEANMEMDTRERVQLGVGGRDSRGGVECGWVEAGSREWVLVVSMGSI